MIGVRVMSKFELRRLARAVGATALPRLTPPTLAEIGHCDDVSVSEVCHLNFNWIFVEALDCSSVTQR